MEHTLSMEFSRLPTHTRIGRHSLLREIFPTQGSNPALLHCKQTLYRLSPQLSCTAGILFTI